MCFHIKRPCVVSAHTKLVGAPKCSYFTESETKDKLSGHVTVQVLTVNVHQLKADKYSPYLVMRRPLVVVVLTTAAKEEVKQ